MSTGYPDWGRAAKSAGQEKAYIGQVISGSVATGALYMGDYASVAVACNNLSNSNHYFVQLLWYREQSLTNEIITQSFVTTPSGQSGLIFPVVSEWLKVEVTNIEATADDTFYAYVYSTDSQQLFTRTEQPGTPFLTIAESIAASGSAVVSATTTYSGPAMMTVENNTTNEYRIRLEYFDQSSAGWLTFLYLYGVSYAKSQNFSIYLPPSHIRATLYNDYTSSEFYNLNIVTG